MDPETAQLLNQHATIFQQSDRRWIEAHGASADAFRPLEAECKTVQFNSPKTPAELQRVADLLKNRPDVELYVYGNGALDLGFLQYFHGLKRLHLGLYACRDFSGLCHVADTLTDLALPTLPKPISLRFIETLPQLKSLFLRGPCKDFDAVQRHVPLEALSISGSKVPHISDLSRLINLRDLTIVFGKTTGFEFLRDFPKLKALRLISIRGLIDLAPLTEAGTLEKICLDGLHHVTRFPDFGKLERLREIQVLRMKGLSDISGAAHAPALTRLYMIDVPKLAPESFLPFLPMRDRLDVHCWNGRSRDLEAIARMFAPASP